MVGQPLDPGHMCLVFTTLPPGGFVLKQLHATQTVLLQHATGHCININIDKQYQQATV